MNDTDSGGDRVAVSKAATRYLLDAATPRPWYVFRPPGCDREVVLGPADQGRVCVVFDLAGDLPRVVVAAVNEYELLLIVADAARRYASPDLEYGREIDDARERGTALRAALARLDGHPAAVPPSVTPREETRDEIQHRAWDDE